jgi:mannose-1-phosphate guanylyltransferase/mannose-6-phosphate isomerase
MKRDLLPAAQSALSAVILAGGSGSRLWPLSRQQLPKQFLRLNGDVSLLEGTVQRLRPLIDASQVLIVTAEDHAKGEAYDALLPYKAVLEPVARNTAPAIAVAAAWLRRERPDAMMVVLPADHVIKDQAAFQAALQRAIEAASDGSLVTFGIRPTRPDTGFGYIKTADASGGVLEVARFTEKPDAETAAAFVEEGCYFWNSGMFVWTAAGILEQIERHLPEVAAVLATMCAALDAGATLAQVMKEHFPAMPDISIDYGVLEKAHGVKLIPCDIGWSDVGSWDALYEITPPDEAGNVLRGSVIAVNTRNCLLRSGKRLIAAVGVEDLCVVETPDAILIAKRGQTQDVREVVNLLSSRNAKEQMVHLTVQRPWGTYTVLEDEAAGFKIKRIEVKPGSRLSLQSHQHRSEHWVVVSGTATIVRGDETITVTRNESTYIPIGFRHRLENRGKIPVQLIEVQVGEYLEENDIERFDDNYGRA